jgi:squalene-hopene/tetraprenyl-beta-curcumene cyclase
MTAGALAKPGIARPQQPETLRSAVDRACSHLLALQSGEGYWLGELEADTTLESDYILLQLWLDPPAPGQPWQPRDADKIHHAARYIRDRQTATGGWNIYPGGPDNLNASVKAYFALKLAGDGTETPHMQKARRAILDLGGIEHVNSYTGIYLSFFGLYDRNLTPTVPPELILLPPGAYLNVYEMSCWSRAILAPLSILSAVKPLKPVPAGFSLAELSAGNGRSQQASGWFGFFWRLDRWLKLWERSGLLLLRREAIRETEKWILERLKDSDGLGAIYPSMLNTILALTELGYSPGDPVLRRAIEKFEELAIHEHGTLRMQPCFSPVWDTALAAFALGMAGAGADAPLRLAADWLLAREVRRRGDWAVKNHRAGPGGWYFQFANEYYPDVDDTAQVLLALRHARATRPEAQRAAEQRAIDWILSMQCKNGGWAAFDVDNDRAILTHVPFADHNAMLDPACADITGRVLEALGPLASGGGRPIAEAVRRAVAYLAQTQEPDGTWSGRWGVNYLYGTCFALRGLRAAGVDPREASILQAAEWIRSVQNADGGWGETCASYDDPALKGSGPSTASQTAWALMGLFASGDRSSGSVHRGVRYLLDTQNAAGGWDEPWFTGTGFPRVFYLKYHLYAQYFPLMALGEYAAWAARTPA